MTSKSLEPITSIFGGGAAAAVASTGEALSATDTDTAGQNAGAGGLATVTPSSPATAAVAGSSVRAADLEQCPIDRYVVYSALLYGCGV